MGGKRKSAFDPRRLMEMAVEVMRRSVAERRTDGKASPQVGAVLWKPDGTIETTSRGELRDGDHAEYALLERKNRNKKLDGAVLFATLEPCAPGSRRHPKLGCAERIVLARIREVYVGIEDPDPMVDRKGIKHLQDSGVTVHMFHRDLQEKIQAANKKFIEQALDRAAAARKGQKREPAVLSVLEAALPAAQMGDLESRVLEEYRGAFGIRGEIDRAEFKRRLVLQGLVKQEGTRLVPTGFGLLLFGKEPRVRVPQAGLLGTIHYADGREETRDFEGPAVDIPAQAIQWLKDKLPNPIARTQAKRKELQETLFELLREGIVNALVHRDYSIAGAKCQLSAREDKVVVMSPGMPVEPITMEQLQAFDAPMLSRNPVMHFVFAKMKLAEERGLGLKSMKSRALAAGLPLPSYSYKAPYVILTLYPDAKSAGAGVGSEVLAKLSESERTGWNWLVTKEEVTTAEYQEAMRVPNRTAKNHLKKLTELGLLRMKGAARATRYRVVRP
jgi:ATP-dependent DNA helicase RecG